MFRHQKYLFNDGDIVGFSGKGLVSDLINIGTYRLPRWGLSHVGIILSVNGKQYIFESTTLNGGKKCAILGKPIGGAQAHPVSDIFNRPGKAWLYRPRIRFMRGERLALNFAMMKYIGRPYDYLGAGRTTGFFLRLLQGVVHKEEVSELFCSELVSLVLTDVGRTCIINSSSQSPNSLMRHLCRHGEYQKRVRLK